MLGKPPDLRRLLETRLENSAAVGFELRLLAESNQNAETSVMDLRLLHEFHQKTENSFSACPSSTRGPRNHVREKHLSLRPRSASDFSTQGDRQPRQILCARRPAKRKREKFSAVFTGPLYVTSFEVRRNSPRGKRANHRDRSKAIVSATSIISRTIIRDPARSRSILPTKEFYLLLAVNRRLTDSP